MTDGARVAAIDVIAVDDCLGSAVVGLLDAFAVANVIADRLGLRGLHFRARAVAANPDAVRAFGGARPFAVGMDIASQPDVLIVPPIMREAMALTDHPDIVFDRLRLQAAAGRRVASVCSGAFLLAEAGVLDGKTATTSHFLAEAFQSRYPAVLLAPRRQLTEDDGIVCAGATTSWLALAIHLIERSAGRRLAVAVAKYLVVDPNAASQQPYFFSAPPRNHKDPDVHALQAWIEQSFAEEISIERLCQHANMSRRSLTRRFRAATGDSPLAYVRKIRLEVAKRLLEEHCISIEKVTREVGYSDARSFSRLFRDHTGVSPGEYRRRFGLAVASR